MRTCALPGPDGAETYFLSTIQKIGFRTTADIPLARVLLVGVRFS